MEGDRARAGENRIPGSRERKSRLLQARVSAELFTGLSFDRFCLPFITQTEELSSKLFASSKGEFASMAGNLSSLPSVTLEPRNALKAPLFCRNNSNTKSLACQRIPNKSETWPLHFLSIVRLWDDIFGNTQSSLFDVTNAHDISLITTSAKSWILSVILCQVWAVLFTLHMWKVQKSIKAGDLSLSRYGSQERSCLCSYKYLLFGYLAIAMFVLSIKKQLIFGNFCLRTTSTITATSLHHLQCGYSRASCPTKSHNLIHLPVVDLDWSASWCGDQ